jgi:hypothetical protein
MRHEWEYKGIAPLIKIEDVLLVAKIVFFNYVKNEFLKQQKFFDYIIMFY